MLIPRGARQPELWHSRNTFPRRSLRAVTKVVRDKWGGRPHDPHGSAENPGVSKP